MVAAVENLGKKKTFEDFLAFPEDARIELIDGEIYMMTPPTEFHAFAATVVSSSLYIYGKAKHQPKDPDGFWVFSELTTYYDLENTFQHYIAAIWKKDLPTLTGNRACKVKPFWVCEVVSPSNQKNDLERKRIALERHLVPYYWIVNPLDNSITVFHLKHPGETYNIVAFVSRPQDGKIKLPPFDRWSLTSPRFFRNPRLLENRAAGSSARASGLFPAVTLPYGIATSMTACPSQGGC